MDAAETARTGSIDGALFDLDGTLLDSRDALLAAWHESTSTVIGRRFPVTPEEEQLVFTLAGAQIFPELVPDAAERAVLIEGFQKAYEVSAKQVRPFPGVLEMLRRLHDGGVAIAVVTSKSRRRYAPDMARAGLEGIVDVAVCAEDSAATKPDPRPLLRALEDLKIPGSRAVMVGDTAVDMLAGVRAGTATIGVTWGHSSGAELELAGADEIAHHPRELVRLILRGVARGEDGAARRPETSDQERT